MSAGPAGKGASFQLAWRAADRLVLSRLAITCAMVGAAAVLTAAAPWFLKLAVDALTSEKHRGEVGFAGDIAVGLPDAGPALLIIAYIGCLWAARSLRAAREASLGAADQRLGRRLNARMIRHLLGLPMTFHFERRLGSLHQIISQGLAGYRIILNHAGVTIAPAVAEALVILCVLASLFNPVIVLIALAGVAASAAAFGFAAWRIMDPARMASSEQAAAFAQMTDYLLNADSIKRCNAQQEIAADYDRALAACERRWLNVHRRKAEGGVIAAFVFALGFGAALLAAAAETRAGAMTVGDFVLVNLYMLQLYAPVESLGGALRDVAYASVFSEKLARLAAQSCEDPRGGALSPGRPASLELRDVCFGYRPRRRVLDKVSFTIGAGECAAIVGASGAGKSSLARIIMRDFDPASGDVRLGGRSILKLSPASVRQAVALVPQEPVLLNGAIADNIALGRRMAGAAAIEQAARAAAIHDQICAMPDGYQTMVGERGLKLSGGERQRIVIARALLRNPALIIFDEAASSLDSIAAEEIRKLIISLSQYRTALIITHQLSMAAHADVILVLDKGAIVEQGRHDDLIAKNGLYAAMWRLQLPHA